MIARINDNMNGTVDVFFDNEYRGTMIVQDVQTLIDAIDVLFQWMANVEWM